MRKKLGWLSKVSFDELVKIMVDYDLLSAGIPPPGEGIRLLDGKGMKWTNHQYSFHEHIKHGVG